MTLKKVAILRFSSIGDIVLISPVIRALYASGAYELHFVTKRVFAQVNIHNKYISKQHLFDKDPKEIYEELKAENFDFVVDLHKNIRSRRLVSALGVSCATFPKLNIRKWILVNFKIDRLPDLHIVDRYMKAIETLEYHRDYAGLDMFLGEDKHLDLSLFDLVANQFTAFVIGAAHFTKRIPLTILKELISNTNGKIALIGGPAEQAQGSLLADVEPNRIVNLCGKTNLQQSAFAIQQSRQVLTSDTGMMHIAAAFHKKIIVLWGNTVPQFGMHPYYGRQINRATHFQVPNLPCRPCSKIGFQSCPKGHFKCMLNQDIRQIIKVLNA